MTGLSDCKSFNLMAFTFNCTLTKRSESGGNWRTLLRRFRDATAGRGEIFRAVFLEQDAQKADTFQVTFTVGWVYLWNVSVENTPQDVMYRSAQSHVRSKTMNSALTAVVKITIQECAGGSIWIFLNFLLSHDS